MDLHQMSKRGCHRGGGGISLGPPPQNNNMEEVLEALLESSESHLLAESLERLMVKRVTDIEKNAFLEKSIDLGQRLHEAANRLTRQLSAEHNSLIWPLTHDLTVKVFSMLGTQTLCYAAATCKLFYVSALDSACYADIDLTSGDFKIIRDMTISKMVQRAGLCFRSLKLGISGQQGKSSASASKLFGSTVNIHRKSADALDSPWHSRNYKQARGAFMLTRSCLNTLSSENVRVEGLRSHTCTQFLTGCPKISSLSLKGFKLSDQKLDRFLKGFCNLKFVDFSTASNVTGRFLRSLSHSGNELQLEILILRDCVHLKEVEVDAFIFALCGGECKYLQYLDISNKDGLAIADWFERQSNPSVEGIARLRSERPQFHLVAEFPAEKSCSDIDSMLSSFSDSDESDALGFRTPSSISMSDFSSESTDNSDTSSDAD